MEKTKFQGFSHPTTTPIPDELFDELMSDLSGAELKVLLYICRRTFGFKKESDKISLNQISNGIITKDGRVLDKGTGLSKRHIQRALKTLELKNAIVVHRVMDDQGINEINTYSLNFAEGVGTKSPYGRDKSDKGVGTPMSTTIYSNNNTTVNNNVRNKPVKIKDSDQVEYYAKMIAEKLHDEKSLTFYKLVCARHNPDKLLRKVSEIVKDGQAKKPAAVFTSWIKTI